MSAVQHESILGVQIWIFTMSIPQNDKLLDSSRVVWTFLSNFLHRTPQFMRNLLDSFLGVIQLLPAYLNFQGTSLDTFLSLTDECFLSAQIWKLTKLNPQIKHLLFKLNSSSVIKHCHQVHSLHEIFAFQQKKTYLRWLVKSCMNFLEQLPSSDSSVYENSLGQLPRSYLTPSCLSESYVNVILLGNFPYSP